MRSTAIALALLLIAGAAQAQTLLCAADLDGDGEATLPSENATCIDLPGGPLCPLQQVACLAMPPAVAGDPTRFACPVDPALPCIDDGAGGASCSPNSCFVRSSVPAEILEPPTSAPVNNGPRDAAGNCIGDLQIFAGESTRCRRAGVETLFSNCCANRGEVITDSGGAFGSVGMKLQVVGTIGSAAGIAATSGLEAANAFLMNSFNPTTIAIGLAMGVLMDMLLESCDARDMEAALLKDSGYCVFLGTYCAERWPLVGCVQRAESHCCYNSKLARIVQEQGRAQLPAMGGFGTPSAPNCRGVRPEEFQAIDFSKIDLSEYFDELTTRSQDLIEGEIRSRIDERL
jgi:conjugal transfer mating pair stabilization protein TraN